MGSFTGVLFIRTTHMPVHFLRINTILKNNMHLQLLRSKGIPVGGVRSSLAAGGSAPRCDSKPNMFTRMSRSSSTCVPTDLWARTRAFSLPRVCSAHAQKQAGMCTIRGAHFSQPFTVVPVFKGGAGACLVFSAVPPWPSMPLPAVGGRLMEGVGA